MRFTRLGIHRPLRGGFTVAESQRHLLNYYFVLRAITHHTAGWIPRTSSLDVKFLLGIHLSEDAHFVTQLRTRLLELGTEADKFGSPTGCILELLNFLGTRESWEEYVAAVYNVVKPYLIDAWEDHFPKTDGLVDEVTTRLLHDFLRITSQHINGGMSLIETMLSQPGTLTVRVQTTTRALRDLMRSFPPCAFDSPVAAEPLQLRRAPAIRRPMRDAFCLLESEEAERRWSMAGRTSLDRFFHDLMNEELTAAELYALNINENPDLPWCFHESMARLVWDEVRHAQVIENVMGLLSLAWGDKPICLRFFHECRQLPLAERMEAISRHEAQHFLMSYFDEAVQQLDGEGHKVRTLSEYMLAEENRHEEICHEWARKLAAEPAPV